MSFLHRVFLCADRSLDRIAREHFATRFADAARGFLVCGSKPALEDASDPAMLQRVRNDALQDSTVTLVLIGRRTWALRTVEAEIRASLRQTAGHERSGLLGVLLPDYVPLGDRTAPRVATEPPRSTFCEGNVPEVLWRNVATGYASVRPYPDSGTELASWIRAAYLRRYGAARIDESGSVMDGDYPPHATSWVGRRGRVPT